MTSTLCNEGLTILEFNLKLSKDDYEKLSKSALTDEYLQQQEEKKANIREDAINKLKMEKFNEEWAKGSNRTPYDEIIITEEEINARCEEEIKQIDEAIETRKKAGVIPGLALNYKQEGGKLDYDKFNEDRLWYASIYIDDTPYYVRNWQSVEKISDYEYKIYTLYSITDDALQGKEEFKITLKNNKLVNMINWRTSTIKWQNDCQRFPSDSNKELQIDLPGEFEVAVSKNNILKDSTVIENPEIKSEFRNITQTVERVVISPIQTIVKIKHSATQQSSNAHMGRYSNHNIEHLPYTRKYAVYDADGNELSCFGVSNVNTLIYADGTREDYDYHDIPNKKYSNATWETIKYLLIENADTDFIKIVPVEVIRNPINSSDDFVGEFDYEMEAMIIHTPKKVKNSTVTSP